MGTPLNSRVGVGKDASRVHGERGEGAGPGKLSRGSQRGGGLGRVGHGGGSDSRPEADRPMESRVGEHWVWATLNRVVVHGIGRGRRHPQDSEDVPQRGAQQLGPLGQGSNIWTEWESSLLPLGSREEPSLVQLCKQEEEVPSLPLGEGREGWSSRRHAGPRGAGCASLLGARRRNLLQQTGDRGCP